MVVEITAGVIASLVATLIVAELKARAPSMASKMVTRAVRHLPRKYRDRYHEEWLAEVAAQPTDASRWGFALGLQFAARVILYRERQRVAVARIVGRGATFSIDVTRYSAFAKLFNQFPKAEVIAMLLLMARIARRTRIYSLAAGGMSIAAIWTLLKQFV